MLEGMRIREREASEPAGGRDERRNAAVAPASATPDSVGQQAGPRAPRYASRARGHHEVVDDFFVKPYEPKEPPPRRPGGGAGVAPSSTSPSRREDRRVARRLEEGLTRRRRRPPSRAQPARVDRPAQPPRRGSPLPRTSETLDRVMPTSSPQVLRRCAQARQRIGPHRAGGAVALDELVPLRSITSGTCNVRGGGRPSASCSSR